MASTGSSVRVADPLAGEAATSAAAGPAASVPDAAAAASEAASDAATAAAAWTPGAYLLAILAILLAAAAWRWRLASLPRGLGPPRRVLPGPGFLLVAALFVAGAIGSGIAFEAAPTEELPRNAIAVAGLVGGQLLLLPLIAGVCRSDRFGEASMTVAIPAGRAVAVGLVAMTAAYPAIATVGNGLQLLQTSLLGDERSRIAHETLATMVSQPASLWSVAMLLLVVVGVPLCEEVFYRRLLQPAIGGSFPAIGRLGAVAASSAIFAAMHLPAIPSGSQWGAMGMLFGVGVVLGWAYERTGRLRAAVAGHGLFNAANVALAVATS